MIHIANSFHHRKIPTHFIFVFILFALSIGVLGYLYHDKQKERLREEEQEKLAAIADLKAGQIEKWRQERLNDGAVVSDPFIVSRIQDFLGKQKTVQTVEDIINWLTSFQVNGPYDGIFLLDDRGAARVSVPASKRLGGRHVQSLIKDVIQNKKMVFPDLYRDETSDKIFLDLLVPLLLHRGHETRLIGILLLRTDPYQFLYPLVQFWPTPSRSAESLLVRREGNEVLFLNELRHKKDTALAFRLPVNLQQNPAAMAARGVEGVVEGTVDYRGAKVLAVIMPIKDSPWFLIAKMDQSEVYASIHEHRVFVILLASALILVAGVMIGLIWRHQAARFYRQQYQIELERQALEKHYSYLTKYANDIIILYDHQLKIREVNERAIASYGYSRDELLQMDVMSLRPPANRVDLQDDIRKINEQKGFVFETVHQRKDGATFPVEASARVLDVEGEKFYQSIIRDISERKKAEEEIRRTQMFLNSIIENIPDMILIKDAKDLRILHANKACEELTGISRAERIGKTAYDLFPKEEADFFSDSDRKALERRRILDVPEEPMNTRHRGLRYLHTKKVPILDSNRNPQYLINISEDITEKKQAEETLRKNEERFKDLYDNAPVGYHEYDREGKITNVNSTDLEMLGYTREEMIGQPIWKFVVEDEIAHQRILAKLAGRMPPDHGLVRTYRRKDGTTLPVLMDDRQTKDENGQITGFRVIIQDIAERKKMEEERERLIHALQETLLKVKTLSGLLPICASCKKIRDDKGYWNQIEGYISEHSEAEFSHSICPECARKLYPEIYEDKWEREK